MAGTTQTDRLLWLLRDKKWHDTLEIMRRVYKVQPGKGICRIASRVNDLRDNGYIIPRAEFVKRGVYRYRLIGRRSTKRSKL